MGPDFDKMNETDVREIIVRPLLGRLGYAHGTQAHIRTEVPLRYEKAFLGRKKPHKDPPLAGRADYICDAISYGRWVVEVKAPNQPLTQDDVEQAHTYSAHPEISALYFLLTNGREFQLYATGQLAAPLLAWAYSEIDRHLMTVFNIVGYDAIRQRTKVLRPDINKPLGRGVPSKLRIVGGEVVYGSHRSDHPLLTNDVMNGKIGAITGVVVERVEDGRLHALVTVRSPYQQLQELNKLVGAGEYHFYSAEEFISTDVERPTIFQNVLEGKLEPGARFTIFPGMPETILPFGFTFIVFTEALGYVHGDAFKGVLSFDYAYTFIRGRPTGNPQIDQLLSITPATARLEGSGTFNVITSMY